MQTKRGSFLEAVINTVIGYIFTLAFSPIIYKIAGIKMSRATMGFVVFMFTIISVIRSYLIRRFFNKLIIRAINKKSVHVTPTHVTVNLNRQNSMSAEEAKTFVDRFKKQPWDLPKK